MIKQSLETEVPNRNAQLKVQILSVYYYTEVDSPQIGLN